MTPKRPRSPGLIANPFIKKRNRDWTLQVPIELNTNATASTHSKTHIDASPSPSPSPSASPSSSFALHPTPTEPTSAAIEAGEAQTSDHLSRFTAELSSRVLKPSSLPPPPECPLLAVPDYAALYRSCAGDANGAHFVIHQHDHPVAGTHYDLRLQINETSSVSWAIMYGLPGDPNSARPMRNATETRIHCLWNHLVETASNETGSLLIWDTGTYSILPRQSKHAPSADPSSPSASPQPQDAVVSQQTLLHAAFQERKIRLRLHGTKLPENYVVNLRLTKSEDTSGRIRSARSTHGPRTRRRGKRLHAARGTQPQIDPSSESEQDEGEDDDAHLVPSTHEASNTAARLSAMERELRELEDEQVRRTNAYPGASNTIGSIHQRKWFLSLDRAACGFVETKHGGRVKWEPSDEATSQDLKLGRTRFSFPFHFRGVDHERSVVTGRQGKDILHDKGVTGFIPRKGWAPITK